MMDLYQIILILQSQIGFYAEINTVDIKKFLIRGAKRNKQLQYPSRDWGYGIIDVYNVFNILRTSFPR